MTYTRAQAYADGVLTDVTDIAREVGFKLPVALTIGALEAAVGNCHGETERGRLLDVLSRAAYAACAGGLEVHFESRGVRLTAAMGTGDAGEPVCTILVPSENM